MLLSQVKSLITFHSHGGKKIPEDTQLSALCLQAMYYIIDRCVPDELLRIEDSEDDVYRNMEDGAFIAIPDTPDFSNTEEHLMIDESLTIAVILYVAFLLTNDASKKIMADEIINEYQANYGREYYVDS